MLVATFALGLANVVNAQNAPAQPTPKPAVEDEVIVLSPFVVNENPDSYRATSTLAGTRINSNLRDLGAAISVVTPEFMKDIGAANIEEVLTYTTATEIGGMLGNHSSAILDGQTGRPDLDAARRETQSTARVRGLQSPNFTRQYFSTDTPGDGYNTGQITVSRGANSLLFGLGSAAGVIDSGLKQAVIGKKNGEFTARYGSQDSYRATFGYNETLIPNRLALRVDSLYREQNFEQKPAFEREKRAYAAFKAVLLENKNSRVLGPTVLRGNYEAGKFHATPPSPIAPVLAFETFFERPIDFRPYTGRVDAAFANILANWQPWAVYDISINPPVPKVSTTGAPIFQQLAVVFDGRGGSEATIGNPGSTLQGFQGRITSSNSAFLSTQLPEEAAVAGGFLAPTLHNRNIYDYRKNLLTGDLQQVNKNFENYSATLEQTFFDNMMGFEATYDRQDYHIDWFQPFGSNTRDLGVYIDVSTKLPNGDPNPNVGRAFVHSHFGLNDTLYRNVARENGRVTAFLDLDGRKLKNKWGKWIGRHVFTGLWQQEDRSSTAVRHRFMWEGVNFDINRSVLAYTTPALVASRVDNGLRVYTFNYISDDLRGKGFDDIKLNTVSMPRPHEGDTFTVAYFDQNTAVTPRPNVWKTGTVRLNRIIDQATPDRTVVESKALAWQSFLLGDSIVGLAGWREDKISDYTRLNTSLLRSPTNEVLLSNLALNGNPNTVTEGRTFTWSVVGHVPRKWMERLPSVVSSITGHYGVGENFSAIELRHDIYNDPIENPRGETTEYGVVIGLKDDKWLLKINRFETASANNAVLPGIASNSVIEVLRGANNYRNQQNMGVAFTSLSNYSSQLAPAGYSSYDQLYNAIFNLVPQNVRDAYDWQINPSSGRYEQMGAGITGLSAVSDITSKGWELELSANPTRNWRISLNAVKLEAVQSNSAETLWDFQQKYLAGVAAAKLTDVYDQFEGATVTFDSRFRTNWVTNTLVQRARDNTANQEVRKYRINFVNNYTFSRGMLKGAGIGAAVRWQSKVATGYATTLDANNNMIPIPDQPFWGDDELNGDLWFSYQRKLTKTVGWKLQLNLRNVIGSVDDIVIKTNPDGRDRVYRIAPERQWFLTSTFTF